MVNGQRIPYSQIKNLHGEVAWRPMLPLTLTYRGQSRSVSGLADTGADVNVLPFHIGIELGAVWDDYSTLVGLSGNLANYEARGILLSANIGEFPQSQLVFAWTQEKMYRSFSVR
jgi:hypothetical protein